MDEVTGRDNQIICQALKIAIPIMQNHSLSSSNTDDMERIFEHRSKGNRVEFPDRKVGEAITLIDELFSFFGKAREDNLEFILFSLQQTHAALKFGFTKNECRRNLNTALHQYWQNKEMGLHSTSQRSKIPQSKLASSTNGKTQVEHVVPLKVIVDMLLEIKKPTKKKVKTVLADMYRVCLVTTEEHKRLSDAGLRSKMPKDWDRKDPFARYKIVGIEVDYDDF